MSDKKNDEYNLLLVDNIKIRVYGFLMNRKAFLWIYIGFFIAFAIMLLVSNYFPFTKYENEFEKLFVENQQICWLVCIIWIVIEGQFFWNRFTAKQLKIIEKQNQIILDQNEELKQQNEEISAQRDEIESQRDEIAIHRDTVLKQKRELTDSIVYASRIQKAILPANSPLENKGIEHFILYKPRDIVSGDFYYFKEIDNNLIIVAADCTGHGVPGAFLSVLGISLLNDILGNPFAENPDKILNELRLRIKKSLHQTGDRNQMQDGMDIAFCKYDIQTRKIQFAGAYNPLIILRPKSPAELYEIIEFKADKMPIGVHPKDETDFTNNEIQLHVNDTFYIFSDGYVSQFGGDKGDKLKWNRFRDYLTEIQKTTIREQKTVLDQKFEQWRGKWEQVDDVLVIGVKI